MKSGTLDREILWETPAGKQVLITSRRLVSFANRHVAAISYNVTLLNAAGLDRLEAVIVMVGIEQAKLLTAVHPVERIVDIEHDALGHGTERTNALNRVLRTVRSPGRKLRSGYRAWPKSPGVKACRMRGPQWSSAKLPSQTDQDCSLSGVIVFWIHTTVPPAARVARASRLTAGTISRACAISAGWPGTMKPFCRSTTTSAVRAGSRSLNGCNRPRRARARSMA